MKKKIYQSPQIKVKVTAHRILCGSYGVTQQNESYDEVDVKTTDGWYN